MCIDLPDELTTADTGEITHNLHLLEIHRRNSGAATYARCKCSANAIPRRCSVNGVADTRREIATLKRRLREWSAPVADVDGDT